MMGNALDKYNWTHYDTWLDKDWDDEIFYLECDKCGHSFDPEREGNLEWEPICERCKE